jgi:hypothetical protein
LIGRYIFNNCSCTIRPEHFDAVNLLCITETKVKPWIMTGDIGIAAGKVSIQFLVVEVNQNLGPDKRALSRRDLAAND